MQKEWESKISKGELNQCLVLDHYLRGENIENVS